MVKKTIKLQIVELKKSKGGWKVNCETRYPKGEQH